MTRLTVLFSLISVLFLGFALSACGGDDTQPTPPPATDGQVLTTDGQNTAQDGGAPKKCRLIEKCLMAARSDHPGTTTPFLLIVCSKTLCVSMPVEANAEVKIFVAGQLVGTVQSDLDEGDFYTGITSPIVNVGDKILLSVSKSTCLTATAELTVVKDTGSTL